MKKILTALFAVGALLLASCQSKDIDNLQTQIDDLKGEINPVSSQISGINATIKTLESTDATIQAAVKELQDKVAKIDLSSAESEINKLKTQVAALQEMDTQLQKQISDLKTYVGTEISGLKDWAKASFATLEKFNSLSDVVTSLDAKVSKLDAALAEAKIELTADYTKAIKEAIAASEASMKLWVAEQLTDYYTIAQTDAELSELAEDVDSAMKSEIKALRAELAQSKKDITEAYTKAIGDAISQAEGRINEKIAADIKTAKEELQSQIDTISGEITDIKSRLSALEKGINTVNGQIIAIYKSISDLQSVDAELLGYIDALKDELASLQQDIEANSAAIGVLQNEISALEASDEAIKRQISELKTYVDEQILSIEDWAEATFATLDKFDSLCSVVAAIPATVQKVANDLAKIKLDVKSDYEKSIKAAVDSTEAGMKKWVNEALTKYWTIAETQARLDTLKADTQDLRVALDSAKAQLTRDYKELIQKAVNDFGGEIGKLRERIAKIDNDSNGEIKQIKDRLDVIESSLKEIKADLDMVINRIQSIVAVPTYSDGSVKIAGEGADNITFDVLPKETIDTIVRAAGLEVYSFNIVKTITKSGTEARTVKVSAASINANGQLVLTVDASSLGSDFFCDEAALAASLSINTKVSSKSSAYFPLYAYHIKLYTDRTTKRQL